MFIMPRAVKCNRCESKAYTQQAEAICQKCMHEWLKAHIGIMQEDKEAPPYNHNDNIAYC